MGGNSEITWQELGVLTCDICQFKTSEQGLLQAHICRKKTGTVSHKAFIKYNAPISKFSCSICLCEEEEHNILLHLQTHLLSYPFKCDACKKGFSTELLVEKHILKKHPSSDGSFTLRVSRLSKDIIKSAREKGIEFFTPCSTHQNKPSKEGNLLVSQNKVKNAVEAHANNVSNQCQDTTDWCDEDWEANPVADYFVVSSSLSAGVSPQQTSKLLIKSGESLSLKTFTVSNATSQTNTPEKVIQSVASSKDILFNSSLISVPTQCSLFTPTPLSLPTVSSHQVSTTATSYFSSSATVVSLTSTTSSRIPPAPTLSFCTSNNCRPLSTAISSHSSSTTVSTLPVSTSSITSLSSYSSSASSWITSIKSDSPLPPSLITSTNHSSVPIQDLSLSSSLSALTSWTTSTDSRSSISTSQATSTNSCFSVSTTWITPTNSRSSSVTSLTKSSVTNKEHKSLGSALSTNSNPSNTFQQPSFSTQWRTQLENIPPNVACFVNKNLSKPLYDASYSPATLQTHHHQNIVPGTLANVIVPFRPNTPNQYPLLQDAMTNRQMKGYHAENTLHRAVPIYHSNPVSTSNENANPLKDPSPLQDSNANAIDHHESVHDVNQEDLVESSSFFFVVNNTCICSRCAKRFINVDLFYQHIHMHLHTNLKKCCHSGYSRDCPLLERIISKLDEKSAGQLKQMQSSPQKCLASTKNLQQIDKDMTNEKKSCQFLESDHRSKFEEDKSGKFPEEIYIKEKCSDVSSIIRDIRESEAGRHNYDSFLQDNNSLLNSAENSNEVISNCIEDIKIDLVEDDLVKFNRLLNEQMSKEFYKCCFENCNFSSHQAIYLLVHMESLHGNESEFYCLYCGYVGEKVTDLLHHITIHNSNQSEKYSGSLLVNHCVSKSMSNQNLDVLMDALEKQIEDYGLCNFQCNICENKFSSLSKLKIHLKISALKTIGCRRCSSIFLDSKSFEHHLSEQHPGTTKYHRINFNFLCKFRKTHSSSFCKILKQYVGLSQESNSPSLLPPNEPSDSLSSPVAMLKSISVPSPVVSNFAPTPIADSDEKYSCIDKVPTCEPFVEHSLIQPRTPVPSPIYVSPLSCYSSCSSTNNVFKSSVLSDKKQVLSSKTTSDECMSFGKQMSSSQSIDVKLPESTQEISVTSSVVSFSYSDKLPSLDSTSVLLLNNIDNRNNDVSEPTLVVGSTKSISISSFTNAPNVQHIVYNCEPTICTSVKQSSTEPSSSPCLSGAREGNNLSITIACGTKRKHSFVSEEMSSKNTIPISDKRIARSEEKSAENFKMTPSTSHPEFLLGKPLESNGVNPSSFPALSPTLSKLSINASSGSTPLFSTPCNHLVTSTDETNASQSSVEMLNASSFIHKERHFSLEKHDCNGKEKRKKDDSNIKDHIATEEEGDKEIYVCNLCKYECKRNEESMKAHISNSKNHQYIGCYYCENPYFDQKTLRNHIRFHHPNESFKYKDLGINYIFSRKVEVESLFTQQKPKKQVQIVVFSNQGDKRLLGDKNEHADDKTLETLEIVQSCPSLSPGKKYAEDNDMLDTPEIMQGNPSLSPVKECNDKKKKLSFGCERCNLFFSSISNVKKHYNKCHRDARMKWIDRKTNNIYSYSGTILDGNDATQPPNRRYICSLCNYRSENRANVHDHQDKKHEYSTINVHVVKLHGFSSFNNNTPSRMIESGPSTSTGMTTKNASTSRREPVRFNCHLCSATLSSEFFLRLHLAKHGGFKYQTTLSTQDGLLICSHCNYIAHSNSDLVNHVSIHVTDRRYTCSLCQFESHQKKSIEAHIEKKHKDENDAKVMDRERSKGKKLKLQVVNLNPTVLVNRCAHSSQKNKRP